MRYLKMSLLLGSFFAATALPSTPEKVEAADTAWIQWYPLPDNRGYCLTQFCNYTVTICCKIVRVE